MDFHCRRCLVCDSVTAVVLRKVKIYPGVKMEECVSKFCFLGDTLGYGGGVGEQETQLENSLHDISSSNNKESCYFQIRKQ